MAYKALGLLTESLNDKQNQRIICVFYDIPLQLKF